MSTSSPHIATEFPTDADTPHGAPELVGQLHGGPSDAHRQARLEARKERGAETSAALAAARAEVGEQVPGHVVASPHGKIAEAADPWVAERWGPHSNDPAPSVNPAGELAAKAAAEKRPRS